MSDPGPSWPSCFIYSGPGFISSLKTTPRVGLALLARVAVALAKCLSFYVMDKGQSAKPFCMQTGLVSGLLVKERIYIQRGENFVV